MSSPSSAQIQKAMKALISSENPEIRRKALYVLQKSRHPKALQAINYASQRDDDKEIRESAAQILAGMPANSLSESGVSWKCPSCDTMNVGGKNCQLCGQPRIDPMPVLMLKPEELVGFLPGGKVINQAASIYKGCLYLFLIPFAIAGIFLILFTVKAWFDWRGLTDSGVVTSGEFIDRRTSTDSKGRITYYATYRFYLNDTAYTREESVSSDIYERSTNGQPIQIIYLPSDPNISNLGGQPTSPLLLTIMTVVWNGFIGAMLFIPKYRSRMSISVR